MVYPFLSHNYADADIKQIYICQSFAFIFPSPFTRAQLCTVQLKLSSSLLLIINTIFQFSQIQSVDKTNQSGQFVTHIHKTHKKSNIFFCLFLIYVLHYRSHFVNFSLKFLIYLSKFAAYYNIRITGSCFIQLLKIVKEGKITRGVNIEAHKNKFLFPLHVTSI